MDATAQKITTFLMFEGNAEEAMTFYISLFDDAEVISIARYGADGPGPDGSVQQATFALAGQQLMCIDSPAKHDFTFTPAVSLFVQCENEAEIDRLMWPSPGRARSSCRWETTASAASSAGSTTGSESPGS